MDERRRRVADNEALFRSVNEQVEAVNKPLAAITESFVIVCECGDISCLEQIHVDVGTYEKTRQNSAHFFVLPGHEILEAEDVIERCATYYIVEKHPGPPQEIAREQDPRTND